MNLSKKRHSIKRGVLILLTAAAIITASLGTLVSCSKSGELYKEGSGDLNVVCTIFPPFDLAKNVGGEKVTLTLLQSNGADLHNFSPTVKTLEALSKADVFVCVGGVSDETWVDDALSAAGNTDAIIVKLTDLTELITAELSSDEDDHDHEHEHEHEGHDHEHEGHDHEHEGDEHVWTSLKNASAVVTKLAEVFSEKDAPNAEYYASNANEYKSKLADLDSRYEKAVENARCDTLVFADRFPFVYLTHDYGINYYAAFSGCSTESNATIEMRKTLTDKVKELSLPAVITIDGSSDSSLADAICVDTGCVKLKMNSMQSVTRKDIEEGASYLKIMEDNLSVLTAALGSTN